MAVAFVQQATGTSGANATSITGTFGSATTSGNLLVLALAGDKNTGTLTATGWTEVYSLASTSVSLYLWWKVSAAETSVTVTTSAVSVSGSYIWIGEYADASVSGSTWQVSAQASHITDETNVTSWATGTTGAATAAGLGIAVDCVDSTVNVTSGPTFGAGWTLRYSAPSDPGKAGPWVGEQLIASGATASGTFSYTGTADQNSGAVAVFTKVAPPEVPILVMARST